MRTEQGSNKGSGACLGSGSMTTKQKAVIFVPPWSSRPCTPRNLRAGSAVQVGHPSSELPSSWANIGGTLLSETQRMNVPSLGLLKAGWASMAYKSEWLDRVCGIVSKSVNLNCQARFWSL